LLLGCSCIYPHSAPKPILLDAWMNGQLEPTNIHWPDDNYHPENSHVIPALIRRFHEAKQSHTPIVSIRGRGNLSVSFRILGLRGQNQFIISKPDCAPRKLMDSSLLNTLGWKATTGLEQGLQLAYQDFLLATSRKI